MKKSLKAHNKLRLGSEFAYLRKHGTKYVGRYLLLVLASAPDEVLRCGVVCGKKYSNRAVKRNRARRLLWESFRMLKHRMKVTHMVLIPRQMMMSAKQPEIQQEMERLLRKAEMLTD